MALPRYFLSKDRSLFCPGGLKKCIQRNETEAVKFMEKWGTKRFIRNSHFKQRHEELRRWERYDLKISRSHRERE
ncbi:hypothetical protein EmuJ_000209300 [Echinococcus multilocularis]|uniref:Uncharacterized protein n=1 Tax=Echinococcus multilocularis TaxID=6211 RepID=A0A087W177_ECHMU|nr:hypothetical protein EmuJ_000209300 [Echinococcus multilocularis]